MSTVNTALDRYMPYTDTFLFAFMGGERTLEALGRFRPEYRNILLRRGSNDTERDGLQFERDLRHGRHFADHKSDAENAAGVCMVHKDAMNAVRDVVLASATTQ